jgi:hypothetical protein
MTSAIEKLGIPIVQITAVPSVSHWVGVTRVLRGSRITNLLGDNKLEKDQEIKLMRRYILRALEMLKRTVDKRQIYTLDGIDLN